MRYYKIIENDKLVAIGTGYSGTEITESEYNELLNEIREKVSLVNQLYNKEITIDDVPEEWQEEVQKRVDEMIQKEQEALEQDISAEEFYSMLEGVL